MRVSNFMYELRLFEFLISKINNWHFIGFLGFYEEKGNVN
jgi:hypothetical protein